MTQTPETRYPERERRTAVRILHFEGVVTESNTVIGVGRIFHGRAVWELDLPDLDPRPSSRLYLNLRHARTSTSALLRGGADEFVGPAAPATDDVHFEATDTAPAVWWGPGDEPGDWIIIICESNSPAGGGDKVSMVFGAVSETHGLAFVRTDLTDPSGRVLRDGALPEDLSRDMFDTATLQISDRSGNSRVKGEIKRISFRD